MKKIKVITEILGYFISIFILTICIAGVLSGSPQSYRVIDPDFDVMSVWSDIDIYGNMGIRWSPTEYVEYKGARLNITPLWYKIIIDDGEAYIYGVIVKRADLTGKVPGILLIHGLGGDHTMMLGFAKELAYRGYVAMAIDAAGHGRSGLVNEGNTDIGITLSQLKNVKYSFLFQVYLSAVRAINALKIDPNVNTSKLGVIGASMGGLTTYVVLAIRDDVKVGIPIVASGCLTCMIESGGLANFVISKDIGLSNSLINNSTYLDPLFYASKIEGKRIFILFSTHDEFFPIEGLTLTLTRFGNNNEIYLSIAPNNNHYRAYPGWLESAIDFIDNSFRDDKGFKKPVYELFDYLILASIRSNESIRIAWRPAVKGFPYIITSANYLIPTLIPSELIVMKTDNSRLISTSSIIKVGNVTCLYILAVAASAYIGYFMIRRFDMHPYKLYGFPLVIAASIVPSLPFVEGSDRFSLNMFQLLERYGVTTSASSWLPAIIVAIPMIYGLIWLVRSARISYGIVAIYVAVQIIPFILVRMLISSLLNVAESIYMLDVWFIPLEIYVLLLGIIPVMARKIRRL